MIYAIEEGAKVTSTINGLAGVIVRGKVRAEAMLKSLEPSTVIEVIVAVVPEDICT
jgi:proteasome assembly chaperone (PAC2) family protein